MNMSDVIDFTKARHQRDHKVVQEDVAAGNGVIAVVDTASKEARISIACHCLSTLFELSTTQGVIHCARCGCKLPASWKFE